MSRAMFAGYVLAAVAGCGAPPVDRVGECTEAIETLLADWGATGEVIPSPAPPDVAARDRLATNLIGEWILMDWRPDGTRELTRIGPTTSRHISFGPDCIPRETERPGAVEPPGGLSRTLDAFSDADLRSALDGGGSLVVYVWSPHMPLSVDGYAEITVATEGLGHRVLPVLIAGSDRTFAEAEAARGGIPEGGLREISSIELIMRDAQVHAPAILVFRAGAVSPVLPGYRNAAGYRMFLEGLPANR